MKGSQERFKHSFTPKSFQFLKHKSPILIEEDLETKAKEEENRRFSCLSSFEEESEKSSKFVRKCQPEQKYKSKFLQNYQTSTSMMFKKKSLHGKFIGASHEKNLSNYNKKEEFPGSYQPKIFETKIRTGQRERTIKQNKQKSFQEYLEQARKQKNNESLNLMMKKSTQVPSFKDQSKEKFSANFFKADLRDTKDTATHLSRCVQDGIKVTDFMKIKKLGQGKNGEVYSVIHRRTAFVCAMKVIRKCDLRKSTEAETLTMQNQLMREIKIQMFFNHPNLIQLYSVFTDSENIYLLQQLGTDGQLYDIMRRKQRFSEESTALISREIAKGLEGLHKRNVIHRDVKPENVVLIYGISKLCDFGWSIYCPKQLRSTLCGTPLYLSPQMLVGNDYDFKIDIWAFGTLTYELYTGENPFRIRKKNDLQRVVNEDIILSLDIPTYLRSFFSRVLEKDSKRRPTASQILKLQFLEKYRELDTSEELSTL